jgi:hypothetical protein
MLLHRAGLEGRGRAFARQCGLLEHLDAPEAAIDPRPPVSATAEKDLRLTLNKGLRD